MLCIKNIDAVRTMAEGGRILSSAMEMLGESIKAGMSTEQLDKLAYKYLTQHGGRPSFLHYMDYPATLCISINEVVIHGIPSRHEIIKDGDIVSIDAGVIFKGFHTDMARTFIVGSADEEKRLLVERTKQSFFEGLRYAHAGNRISDISHGVEEYISQFGYGIVRDFTGHGVGRALHEAPEIPNYGVPGHGVRIVNGMTLAIEPMICLGGDAVEVLSDGWTTVTVDKKCAAHYENTIAIVDGEAIILTDPNAKV